VTRLQDDVAQFLYREARLLDERRFEEWLELFADNGLYWLPMGYGDPDPSRDVSLIYDDRKRIGLRIRRLRGKYAFAQDPATETCRTVSNVEVDEDGAPEGVDLAVQSVETIFTMRRGRPDVTVGRCRYHLNGTEPGRWQIALKRVDILSRNQGIHDLGFLV
jgi:3-phenylpropionate/cinnamic acid dioxygenase small subunit